MKQRKEITTKNKNRGANFQKANACELRNQRASQPITLSPLSGICYTQKRLDICLRWVFIGKFSQQTKAPRFRVVFHLANFFYLTNGSVQVILFPLNLTLRVSLRFLAWKVKEALGRCWFCWLLLCMTHLISLQW